MRIKYLLTIVVFFLLDLFIFFHFQEVSLKFRSLFWISHFTLSAIFIYVNNLFSGEKQFDIFILIFPVIGYFILFINQFLFFRKYFQSEIEVSDDLEKYIQDEEEKIIVNRSIDLNLIGAYDVLAVGTSGEKKDFLIGFETQNLKFKVQVLKKALWDEDIEVIHYAATEINKIDENFQLLIKEKTLKGDIDALCKIYFHYCSSGLLVGEVLEFYQNRCIELIRSKKEYSLKDKYKLLSLCKDMGENCEAIVEDILKNKEIDNEILEFIKKYYYDLNNYEKLKEVERWQKSV